jgi:glucose-6-phosphate isomerase
MLARRREVALQAFQAEPPAFTELRYQDLRAIKKFAREARANFEGVIVLGIGGSALGGQALVEALGKSKLPIHFLDNADPDQLAAMLRKVRLKKTLLLVISKSGGTLETLASFFYLRPKLGKNWQKQVVVITDPKVGYLRKLAQRERLTSFEIPPEVGGRYSVLSPVGLVPAALAGIRIEDLLFGAQEVDLADAYLHALVHAELFKQGQNITVFCPYSSKLKRLGEWYAQLLAESLGKKPEVGLTPEVSLGATDQHSKLQLWMQGPPDKFFIFLGLQKYGQDFLLKDLPTKFSHLRRRSLGEIMNAEFEGTLAALSEAGRNLAAWDLPEVSPRTLGHLLYFFECEVVLMGALLGVDPFTQPGVERGKVLTRKRLEKK